MLQVANHPAITTVRRKTVSFIREYSQTGATMQRFDRSRNVAPIAYRRGVRENLTYRRQFTPASDG
jgi:hypothetical protein